MSLAFHILDFSIGFSYTAGVVGGLSAVAMCAPSDQFLYMGGALGKAEFEILCKLTLFRKYGEYTDPNFLTTKFFVF